MRSRVKNIQQFRNETVPRWLVVRSVAIWPEGMRGPHSPSAVARMTALALGEVIASTSTVPVARISELMVLHSIRPVRTPILCMRSGDNSIDVSGGAEPSGGVLAVKPSIGGSWKRICGGCHLNRSINELIRAAGFHITDQRNFYLPGPRPMTYTYQGVACIQPPI